MRISDIDFTLQGKEVIVEGKKTKEISPFCHQSINVIDISDVISAKEAIPYISVYRAHKEDILNELKRSLNTRRCVLDFNNNTLRSDNPNCIVSLQFIFRDKMNAIAYARSSDIKKYEDDLATIKYIMKDICKELELQIGTISFLTGSMHKYLE